MYQYINDFLINAKKHPIICIVGPTGCGKTALSLRIAKEINGEIINADSKQLYKGLRITTGHISEEEMQGVSHHLFGYVEPSVSYTVEDHRKDALKVINDLLKNGKCPIFVGGTGLFINALTKNFKISTCSRNNDLREKLKQKLSDDLWNELNQIDPKYASITHKNNRVRVIRALEVYYTTGKKKSEGEKGESKFDFLILMPKIDDRKNLYQSINNRVFKIWESGLLDEAKILFNQKLDEKLPALMSIGIPEAFSFFRGEISESEAIERMQQKSRNYAKRQLTWWRGDERVITIFNSQF